MTCTQPGAAARPDAVPTDAEWLDAAVPGTAAAALRAAGQLSAGGPARLNELDVWYAADLPDAGEAVLHFAGLATHAEIWLDGALLGTSETMFAAQRHCVRLGPGSRLHLCFRALHKALERPTGRARWRSALARPAALRQARTTLLGHMPGWCPEIHAVGPWRAVELLPAAAARLGPADLRVSLRDGVGHVGLRLAWDAAPETAELRVGTARTPLHRVAGGLAGALALEKVRPWWPHTHGEPVLYPASLQVDGQTVPLGGIGFRTLEIDRGAEKTGFAIRVNGERIFCRGACWTTADLVELPGDAAACLPALQALRHAGMNMVRVPGLAAYETRDFFALCDELGVLVWQDFMFARFDYPADEAFLAAAAAEARHFLGSVQGCASLAVLCGGSEMAQQAAMLGRPDWHHPLFDRVLPELCADSRPDVPFVPHAPDGGAVPFAPEEGISHWWGVGAYLRPLDEARRAPPRFAAACLAFANLPDAAGTTPGLPVPRDPGAWWDFADVRDHYLRALTGQDPAALRRADPDAYSRASRATVAEVMQAVFAEWRRTGSACAGALVWVLQDVAHGAGWGLLDAAGVAKSPLHALREVLRPVQVLLTPEGMNGLHVHVLNETAEPLAARLHLSALRDGAVPVAEAVHDMVLPPRSATAHNAMALHGGFFDFSAAYQFGPPGHDAVLARLADHSGATLSEAFFFPRPPVPAELGLEAWPRHDDQGWTLTLRTARLARFVHVEDDNWRASEEWFHLPPARDRRIRLLPRRADVPPPFGLVQAMNAARPTRYGAAA